MLDDLVSVIETLQRRIRDHGPTLRENETRTRMGLIDPLLRVLGWDVSDPSVVTPEYNVGNGRADYALLNRDERPAALIEAKHFSEPLERPNHQEQVFTYALMQQVRYAGLTDGDRWILDDVSVFSGERRILDLSIANTSAHVCALQLLLLWRPNLASGQPAVAQTPLLSEEPEPAAYSERTTTAPSPVPTSVGDDASWIALSAFAGDPADALPSSMRFPNWDEYSVNNWNQLVRHAVAWLSSRELLTANDVPIPSSKKRFIVSTEPVHPAGNPFAQKIAVTGTPFVYEGNISRRAAVSNAKKLLEYCNVDPADVLLRMW